MNFNHRHPRGSKIFLRSTQKATMFKKQQYSCDNPKEYRRRTGRFSNQQKAPTLTCRYPHAKEIPYCCHYLSHSLGTLIHKPTVKLLAPHSCLPIRDPQLWSWEAQPPAISQESCCTRDLCTGILSFPSLWEHGAEKMHPAKWISIQ